MMCHPRRLRGKDKSEAGDSSQLTSYLGAIFYYFGALRGTPEATDG